MFKHITKKPLWFNILFGIGMILAVFFIFFLMLDWITKHGESKTVPAVTGKNIDDITTMLEDRGFEVIIQDSLYYDSLPPGMVIKQVPEADDVVKVNRTVYVTINRFVPPDVDMPNLVGATFRTAEMSLQNLGLKLGDTTYRQDFARNSVLDQLVNGERIKAGTKIRVGSIVDLVLGTGVGNVSVPVPKLVGQTFCDVRTRIEAQGFVLIHYSDPNVKDTCNAFVYRQNPTPKTEDGLVQMMRTGQLVEVWLSVEPPVIDSTERQPIPQPQ